MADSLINGSAFTKIDANNLQITYICSKESLINNLNQLIEKRDKQITVINNKMNPKIQQIQDKLKILASSKE